MIFLQVVDKLQQYFGDMVWIQATPLRDSHVTNNGLTFLVSEVDTRPLDQDGIMHSSNIQVTTVIRDESPDPDLLIEADHAINLIIKSMESSPQIDKSYRQSGKMIPHIDSDIMMRYSVFEITYRIYKGK